MNLQWIKLALNTFDDEKIQIIETMPDNYAIQLIWVKLLIYAGKSNSGGALLLNNAVPYTNEMLAGVFRMPLSTVKLAISIFEKFGMINIETTDVGNEYIYLPNWEKHQNIDGMDKIREQSRLRMQKSREKQKLLNNNNNLHQNNNNDNNDVAQPLRNSYDNVADNVTHGYATEEEVEVEKEIELNTKKLNTEEEDFRGGENRPAESGREKSNIIFLNKKTNLLELSDTTLNLLQDAYPDIDISQKLKEMSVWLIAHTETVTEIEQFDNNFIRFVAKWLSNENDKKKNKKKTTNTRNYAISFNPETANLIGADNDYVNILKSKFLGINVETEIKKMESWLFNNPSKRPAKDYPRFINRWLAQEQDKVSTRHSSQGQFIPKTNQSLQTFAEIKMQNSLNAVEQISKEFLKQDN
ncbi:MAG: phage replisome organizer N-terminal domain-containing protein [bacterium]